MTLRFVTLNQKYVWENRFMFVDAQIVKKERIMMQITLTDQLIETTKSTRLNFTASFVYLKKYENILAESFL